MSATWPDESGLTLEVAPDATLIADANGSVVFANRQVSQVFGYTPEEVIGEPIEILIPERFRSKHVGHRSAYAAQPKFRPMGEGQELVGLHKDGTEFPVEISLGPMSREDTAYICASIRDVSERVEAEAQLNRAKDVAEKATATKSRFLAAASHDLRQPLQTVTIYASVLKQLIAEDPATAAEVTEKIETSLGVMGVLLDALLDISKLDTGAIVPEKTSFSLQALFDEIQTDNTPTAAEKGLDLTFEPTDSFVYSDAGLLQRILENFVTNAIRYTEQGHVAVRAELVGDSVRVEVQDTGIGIPESSLNAIFEEYFQLENPVRDRRKGLGLGLSIVKHMADLLDNPVDVASTVGEGSIFAVTVPVGVRLEPDIIVRTDPVPDQLQAPLILIAEDDPEIVEATSLMLELAGMRVEAVQNGDDGIALLREGLGPDMIVSDYRLPGANGIELIGVAKELHGEDFPAVMVTGDTSNNEVRGTQLKNCEVLTKPVDADRLVRAIELSVQLVRRGE